MIKCSSPECTFWVHAHHYQGVSIAEGDSCPYCQSPLQQVTPEDPYWIAERIRIQTGAAIDPQRFIDQRSGKIKILTVRRYAEQHNLSEAELMEVVKPYCVPCQERQGCGQS